METWAIFSILGFLAITQSQGADVPDYKDQDIDALLAYEPPKNFASDYPWSLSGFDDDNAPIFLVEYGKWDVRKAIDDGQEREMKLYVQQLFKKTLDLMELKSTPDDPVTQLNFIFDMDGFGSRQASSPKTVEFNVWLARNLAQAWKNKLKVGFLLNTNYLFSTIFTLMKPVLGPNVYKVEVFGNNRERWLPAVVKVFPKTEIPEYYGGEAGHKPVKIFG